MRDYDTIMERLISGDVAALEDLSKVVDDFPCGKDDFIHRDWITNAIDCGTFEVIEWMLSKGVSLHLDDAEGYPVLHSAMERDKPDRFKVMQLLIDAGADINARGINDYTPAHKAAAWGDFEALQFMVDAGADLTMRTRIDEYETPLGEAIAMGSTPNIIAYLQKKQTEQGGASDR